jgi:putative glycosyltransferase
MSSNKQIELSIVTTLYGSSSFIDEFYKKISKSAGEISNNYEIVFVNDGSPDDALLKAKALSENDIKVKVVNLSRNFGHHNAMLAGLLESKGDKIFLIDVDLEEEPKLLVDFWHEFHLEDKTDVVYGVAKSREGGIIRKNLGSAFYDLFNSLSQTKIPENILTIRLMSRRYVDAIAQYQETSLFLGGLFANAGFNQKSKFVYKNFKGATSYTLRKRVSLLVNAITSFSSKPLEMFVYIGSVIFVMSFLAILVVMFRKFVFGIDAAGWASVIVALSFFGGLQIFSIGVIGTYLGKVYNEVKKRPRFIVSDIYQKEEEN